MSSMLRSSPVPTWYVSPTRPRASPASKARQGTTAWILGSSYAVGLGVIGSGRSCSAWVTKNGMTFSGNWYGP